MSAPLFVQISSARKFNSDHPFLYALDEFGGVWEYSFWKKEWVKLGEERRDA